MPVAPDEGSAWEDPVQSRARVDELLCCSTTWPSGGGKINFVCANTFSWQF